MDGGVKGFLRSLVTLKYFVASVYPEHREVAVSHLGDRAVETKDAVTHPSMPFG
jgi:hypothetical protein